MDSSARFLPTLLLGLGVGAVGGAYLGSAAVWFGIVAAVVGVGLSLTSSRPATVGGEARVQSPSEGAELSTLGSRVEQILRLAEEQAENHRSNAKREAERTLSKARSEARLIVDKARAEAAGLTTGTSKSEIDRSSSEQ